MPRLNIATRGIFATPVAAVELPDAETRNRELSAIILRRRAETAGIRASNAGGWHSERGVAGWGGLLAGLCTEGNPIIRVQAWQRIVPESGAALRRWLSFS